MKTAAKNSTIRVMAGRLKGRAIAMVKSETTRSTKSILKESFFNTLGVEVVDSVFVEGFAGTGSMGIEALSRGARRAVFLERGSEAFGVLKHNLKNLELESASECFLGDSFELLPRVVAGFSGRVILYLDPPFAIREHQAEVYERCYALLERLGAVQAVALVALEHMGELETPERIGGFVKQKTRRFGKSAVSYWEREASGS